eukprot:349875-Chlamydomonas_euryale.AAC.8
MAARVPCWSFHAAELASYHRCSRPAPVSARARVARRPWASRQSQSQAARHHQTRRPCRPPPTRTACAACTAAVAASGCASVSAASRATALA